jgi:hypothetical protein
MWAIQRVHLPVGQRIYRFGSTTAPDLWYTGGWWMRFEDVTKVRASSEAAGISLGYAARRLLAVRYEWPGKVNVLVSAIVAGPLDAYAGKGRVQDRFSPGEPPPGAYEWHPPPDVMQLYIPGLADDPAVKGMPLKRSVVGRKALCQERHEFIRSEEFR